MSIKKTHSIVLSTIPYRESSLIATLFTREYGRINVIVKGIKRKDSKSTIFERGYEIEHLTYLKPHKDLHLITECRIVDHFPGIRYNLEKTAIRDLMFEIFLTSVKEFQPCQNTFDFLKFFLSSLDKLTYTFSKLLFFLSEELFKFAACSGFQVDFRKCFKCGSEFDKEEYVIINIENGILLCNYCSQKKNGYFLPLSFVKYVLSEDQNFNNIPTLSDSLILKILQMASYFCCYHFDIKKKLSSLNFIYSLLKADFNEVNAFPFYNT